MGDDNERDVVKNKKKGSPTSRLYKVGASTDYGGSIGVERGDTRCHNSYGIQ